jgi:hypothetical protein
MFTESKKKATILMFVVAFCKWTDVRQMSREFDNTKCNRTERRSIDSIVRTLRHVIYVGQKSYEYDIPINQLPIKHHEPTFRKFFNTSPNMFEIDPS